jgi:hypothetical protein
MLWGRKRLPRDFFYGTLCFARKIERKGPYASMHICIHIISFAVHVGAKYRLRTSQVRLLYFNMI